MRFIEQHIVQVEIIFEAYQGNEPLHLFLKKYFKKQKKFGSRDRRNISEYLYGVFRMGRENRHLSVRERVYIYLLLKGELDKPFFQEHFPELVDYYEKSLEEKLNLLTEVYQLRPTFRTQEEISEEINALNYRNSFYQEPHVFIRIRNNKSAYYNEIIKENKGVLIENDCYSFPPKTKLETFLEPIDYVVQDVNSQRTGSYFDKVISKKSVWDCCAGSGGKSILLLDKYPEVLLTVTDIRASILRSLLERFELYGLEAEMIAEVNVNKQKELTVLDNAMFDFIICDVPCTGSGTWARTPEQFYYFDKKEVSRFQKRQLDILKNTSSRLSEKGSIIYITCSVFRKENEEVVERFLELNSEFSLEEQVYLDGTLHRADTLFVSLLTKK